MFFNSQHFNYTGNKSNVPLSVIVNTSTLCWLHILTPSVAHHTVTNLHAAGMKIALKQKVTLRLT